MVRSTLRWPFWNDDAGRARAVWRIALPLVVTFAFLVLTSEPLDRLVPHPWSIATKSAVRAVVAVGVVAVSARTLDRRPFADYGFHVDRGWITDLLAGVGIGLLATGGTLAAALAVGWAEIETLWAAGEATLPAMLLTFAVGFAFVGLWEELLFRGVFLRIAAEGLSGYTSRRLAAVGGLVLSSVVFGVLHAPQAGSPLALTMWVFAGFVLGAIYLLTDELALPIGVHAAVNFGYNPLYGLSTASVDGVSAVVLPTFVGPDWAIGGGGVLDGVMFALVGVLAVAWIAVTRSGDAPWLGRWSAGEDGEAAS